jgi:hypothetical protein
VRDSNSGDHGPHDPEHDHRAPGDQRETSDRQPPAGSDEAPAEIRLRTKQYVRTVDIDAEAASDAPVGIRGPGGTAAPGGASAHTGSVPIEPGSKYVPPALNEPDAAARVAASAAAARAAARAVTARLGDPAAGATAGAASATPRPASSTDAAAAERSEVALRSDDAPRPAKTIPFTSPDTVIDRSQYVIGASDDSATHASDTNHSDASTQPRVVYLEAPTPPVKKGNRGIGSAIALLSSLAFAILFALVIFALFYLTTGRIVTNFLTQASFFVPVVLFALAFVVLVLIANRAGWWAYVLGSIAVGAFTYVATIGVLLLLGGLIASTPQEASADLARALVNPLVIAAGVLAREVSLWTGWAISVHGRRVSARNAEQAEKYQRELDDRDNQFSNRQGREIHQNYDRTAAGSAS